jgi:MFS family permease
MGLFNIAFSIGMTIGPIMVGSLLDITGNGIPFYILSAFLAASALPFFPVFKRGVC